MKTNTIAFILSNTERTETGCLLYLGSNTLDYHGYCRTSLSGKKGQTHRHVYTALNGDIPKGYIIMHTCDNRSCINPDHLQLGTNKENSEDMVRKNR